MAEGVLFSVAGEILKTLCSIVATEIGQPSCFQNDLENLQLSVSSIKAVLLDAEEKRAKSKAVSLWLEKLSEVLYEADDLLDDISTEALQHKKVGRFFLPLKQSIYDPRMSHCIKYIRGKIDAIAANITQFQFLVRQEGLTNWRRDDTYSYLGPEIVIGREDDKKAVLDLLTVSNVKENVSFVSIVGIGGLGKTTLAKLIFNDQEFEKTFDKKMWICVSDNFNVKVLVKKIVESIREKIPESDQVDIAQSVPKMPPISDQMEILVGQFREEIEGKKYLLVLDDVWCEDIEKLFELSNLLMCGGTGSRILVTTRKLSVANVMQTKRHQLDGLGDKDSGSC